MIRPLALALSGTLTFSAPAALAQHAAHQTQTQTSQTAAPQAAPAHGHAHADFESDRFHVRIDGPENPVGDIILIPGLSSSPEVWDGLTEALKDRYRIHRLHVQGFAGAPAEANASGRVATPVAADLARYIRQQQLDKPVVIGHSMGGTIAMMLAARHPSLVGKLMVVDMIPFMGVMFGGPQATAQSVTPMADMVAQGMRGMTPEAWRASAANTISGMINTEAARAGPIEDSATTDQNVAAASMRELIMTDLRPELANITAPTEILYVAFNRPGMTPEMTDGIYTAAFANLPGAKLKRIDDSAHFIMQDQPERFLAEVNAFLE